MVLKISVVSVKRDKGNTSKGITFIRKISTEMNRSIWILPGISGFSVQMLSVGHESVPKDYCAREETPAAIKHCSLFVLSQSSMVVLYFVNG